MFSIRPKKTTRTVIDLSDACAGTLTIPLKVLRDIVESTSEFTDEARAQFHVNRVMLSYLLDPSPEPSLRSLTIEEER